MTMTCKHCGSQIYLNGKTYSHAATNMIYCNDGSGKKAAIEKKGAAK